MAMDFTKTRVDTSGIERSASSEGINAQQASVTDMMTRALGRSQEFSANAIGQGIAGAASQFDPEHRAAIEYRNAQRQAATTDLAQRQAADVGRSQSQLTTARQLAQQSFQANGQPMPADADIVRGGVDQVLGAGAYDGLTATQRQAVDTLFSGVMDQSQRRVLPGGENQIKAMGRHYDPEYVGVSPNQALMSAHGEFMNGLQELATKSPLFAPILLQRNEEQIATARAKESGAPEVAAVIAAHNTPSHRELATSILPYYRSGELRPFVMKDGSTKLMTIGDYARSGDADVESITKNIGTTKTAWPLIGINEKGQPEEQLTDEALRSMAPHEKAIMSHYVGQDVGTANRALVGVRAASTILSQIRSGAWLPKDDGKPDGPYARAKQAQNQINEAIKRGDATEDQAALAIASAAGWTDLSPAVLSKDSLMGGQSDSRIREAIAQAKLASPDLAAMVDGEGAKKAFEAQWDRSIKKNVTYDMNGPLSFLRGADPGMVSTVLTDMGGSTLKQPMYQEFTNHIRALGGLTPREAEQMSRQLYGTFERNINYARNSYVAPNGKRFDQLSPADQYSVLLGVGHEIIKPALDAKKIATGTDSRSIASGILGVPAVSAVDAQKRVSDYLKQNPEIGLGPGELKVGDKLAITFDRGRARGIKHLDGGEWKTDSFADRTPQAADAATRVALVRKVYSDAVKDRTPMDVATASSSFRLGGSGNPLVDGALNEKVNGVSIYDWVRNTLGSADDPPSSFGPALDRALNDYAAKSGRNIFDMRAQLQAAAKGTDDPVVDAVAMYVEQSLATTADTVDDIQAMEGDDMSELARLLGKDEALQQMATSPGGARTALAGAQAGKGSAESRPESKPTAGGGASSGGDPLANAMNKARGATAGMHPITSHMPPMQRPENWGSGSPFAPPSMRADAANVDDAQGINEYMDLLNPARVFNEGRKQIKGAADAISQTVGPIAGRAFSK